MKKYLIVILILLVLSGIVFYFFNKGDIINISARKKDYLNEGSELNAKELSEFQYNYQNTEFAEKEKQVLEIGKREAIKKFGEEKYKSEMPFEVNRLNDELGFLNSNYIWHFSGTLHCGEG